MKTDTRSRNKNMKHFFVFIREKFDVLLIAGLFIFTFLFWYFDTVPDRSAELSTLNQGLLYALLALLGLRPRAVPVPVPPPLQIKADHIETANTETGDIVGIKDAAGDSGEGDDNYAR